MLSLSPAPTDHQALAPFPLASEFPFAAWSDLDTRAELHPELARMWQQVKRKFWYRGHPAAGAMFAAVYAMSLRPSFRVGVGR